MILHPPQPRLGIDLTRNHFSHSQRRIKQMDDLPIPLSHPDHASRAQPSAVAKLSAAAREKGSLIEHHRPAFSVSQTGFYGCIELQNVSKSYDGRTLINDFSYIIQRDARIGIIGRNGCGKSTLLSMIAGRLQPDSGEVITGETVKLGFFSQEGEEMDPGMRMIDYIREHGEYVETSEGRLTAAQLLEQFLFPSYCHYQPIGKLSGGERRRLFLLRILIEAPNILLLDEPTNDLDIQTLMILENFLEGFKGAVIAVAHDRYFLDKMADHILSLDGDGNVKVFLGGYSDYLLQQEETAPQKPKTEKSPAPRRSERPQKLKFTFKEQREYETIDDDIAALEEKISLKEKEIEQSSSDFSKLQQLLAEKEELELALSEKEERWIYLTDLAERIENQ